MTLPIKWCSTLIILTLLSCNLKMAPKNYEIPSEPIYLTYKNSCKNLHSSYEKHIYSVLKFYKEFYSAINKKSEIKYWPAKISGYIHLRFSDSNHLEDVKFKQFYSEEWNELTNNDGLLPLQDVLRQTILKLPLTCFKPDSNSTTNMMVLPFAYYKGDLKCLSFPQDDILQSCDLTKANFKVKVEGTGLDYELLDLRHLKEQQLEIKIHLQDYMWNCYGDPQIPIVYLGARNYGVEGIKFKERTAGIERR